MPANPMRNSMRASRAMSFTPTLRCAPTRTSSSRTTRASLACGVTRFPAICRSCCCGLRTRRISAWRASSYRPTRYWRLHGLAVDLVIVSENHDGQRPALHEQIANLIAECGDVERIDQPGGDLRAPRPARSRKRTTFSYNRSPASSSATATGRLRNSSNGAAQHRPRPRRHSLHATISSESEQASELPGGLPERDLIFHNGLGGFTPDGLEYVVTVTRRAHDSGTVGKRFGQPVVRDSRLRKRQRQYLERERAGVSSHAVVQ